MDKKNLWEKLKHAFSVEQKPLDPETDYVILEKAANFIVNRKLTAPATFALESLRPLSFIGSQMLIVVGPFIDPFMKQEDQSRLVQLLEHREGVELLLQMIEKKNESPDKVT